MQRDGDERVVETVTIDIYVGLREGYDGKQHHIEDLKDVLQEICNKGLCVSVFPCDYVYKNGREKGAMVRLINYPRFPSNKKELKEKAIDIAKTLRKQFGQNRISVMAPDLTYMLGE